MSDLEQSVAEYVGDAQDLKKAMLQYVASCVRQGGIFVLHEVQSEEDPATGEIWASAVVDPANFTADECLVIVHRMPGQPWHGVDMGTAIDQAIGRIPSDIRGRLRAVQLFA